MRRLAAPAVLGLLVFALPAWTGAQGLGAVAAREKSKRSAAGAKPGARSFDNADLDRGRRPGTTAGGGEGAAGTQSATAGESGSGALSEPEPDRNAQEKPLLDAISAAQEGVAAVEARIRELSDKLNPMSITFIYGAAQSGDAAGEEARTRQELSEAQTDLLQARQALAAAQEALRESRRGSGGAAGEPR